MTTDDTARLAEIRVEFLSTPYPLDIMSGDDVEWLITALTDALERERVLIENVARLCDALKDCLMALEHEGIHAKRIAKLLSAIEGGK